jgi:hypothetical protein
MPRQPGELLGLLTEDASAVEVVSVGGARLVETFLQNDLARHVLEGSPKRLVPLDDLRATSDRAQGAVLLHVGRCGSTLLARALATDPQVVVLREPPLLAALLGLPPPWRPDPDQLAAAGSWYADFASERGGRLVLKLTSTAFLHVPDVVRAFPGSLLWALVRDPFEVAASVAHSAPPWYRFVAESPRARAALARPLAGIVTGIPDPAATAAAIWRIGVEALAAYGDRVQFIGYRAVVDDLPGVVERLTAELVGDDRGPVDRAAIATIQSGDAKGRPAGRPIVPPLDAATAEVVARIVEPAMALLDARTPTILGATT